MSVDINIIRRDDKVTFGTFGCTGRVTGVGDQYVLVIWDGPNIEIKLDPSKASFHLVLTEDDFISKSTWSPVTLASSGVTGGLGVFGTAEEAARCVPEAVGAIKLIPETNDDGTLKVVWRDSIEGND